MISPYDFDRNYETIFVNTILLSLINTPLLTSFTSVSRESSQTHTFSSVFITDLVRSLIIEAIASCGILRTKGYNQGYNILCNSLTIHHVHLSTSYKIILKTKRNPVVQGMY